MDTTTKGNWKGIYGTQGYNIVNDSLNYPSYAQVNVTGYTSPTWMASTTDVRALQKATGTDRLAARWSANSSFTIDLNITDGQYHRVALYSLDWDGNNRAQRIDVFEWATNRLLDSKAISAFNGGQYLVWDIRGRVKISVNRTGAKTAVLSGLYFGGGTPVPTPTPTPTPSPSPTPTPNPGSNIPPAVMLTSPVLNSVFGTGSNLTIQAAASDSDGSIAKVDIYKNGSLIGTTTVSPYNYVWQNLPNGNYSLTAVATDNRGATTSSSPVAISVKNSPASIEKARGRGNDLLADLATNPNYGGGEAIYSAATLSSELQLLANDVQAAYSDFLAEQGTFAAANSINRQLQAALYLAKADAGLAAKVGPSNSVRSNLLRLVAHLAVSQDLLLYGFVSASTQAQAAAANARLDVNISPVSAAYTLGSAGQLAPLSLGSVFGDSSTSPFGIQTLFSPIGPGGTLPYELAGVSVVMGGKAVPVSFAGPGRVSFYVSPEVPTGNVEVIVISPNGFISRGQTTVAANALWLFTTNENDGGSAVAFNAAHQIPATFNAVTQENFGFDKRTRVTLYVTGISGSAPNSDLGNDISVDGVVRQNLAESVVVQALISTGARVNLPVEFAGKHGLLPGLDQVSFVIPSQLAGAGLVQLTFLVGGQRSNGGTIVIR